ncbi:MAG: PEP-CTERM sorting domain-containing protein [Phycisphaerae bacterium]
MKQLIALSISIALIASAASAAVLFEESFDYGNTTDNIQNVSNWSTNSGVLMYDHDGGLDHSALAGETGGSFWHDYASGSRDATNSADVNFDITIAEGSEMWFAALAEYSSGGQAEIRFSAGSVNDIGFGIDSGGNVFVEASDNGGASADHDTGLDAAADGTTYLLLMRATRGADGSPIASTIDFWFDPADASSLAALGAADWTTGADSKWGRDSQANYGSVLVEPAYDARVDEIRVGESLADLNVVPEPATMSLLGLGGLVVLRRRRNR